MPLSLCAIYGGLIAEGQHALRAAVKSLFLSMSDNEGSAKLVFCEGISPTINPLPLEYGSIRSYCLSWL